MKKIIDFIKKRYIYIILIIIISGLAIYFFWPKIELVFMKKYSSENFILHYPKNWDQLSLEELSQNYPENIKFGIKKQNTDNTILLVRVDEMPGKKSFNIEGSISEIKGIYPKKFTDFKLDSINKTTFNDLPAIEIEYGYSAVADFKSQDKRYSHQKQIIFLYKEKLYWLMFGSLPQDFQRDNKDFQKILDSFRLK